jgi:SAM-dependent methyltransferase
VAEASEGAVQLYGELADWFHLLTAPSEYADEAADYRRLLDATGPVHTVLELGSGGGNNASHLKAHYDLTLVDVSERMIALSRRINPRCEHVTADMRTVRLKRQFDAVFIHDAIDYMVSLDELRAAMTTAYEHLRPGGVVLLCPDHLRDTFAPMTDHGGHDEGDRGLRYLEWTWDPDPSDTTYTVDFAYLLREGSAVRAVHDRHVCGLFTREQWCRSLAETGFRCLEVHPGPDGIEMFTARR